jgi:hypothetical protein
MTDMSDQNNTTTLAHVTDTGAPVYPTGWQPLATVPRDGTKVDMWSTQYQSRSCNLRFLPAAHVDERYAPGGVWEHLGQDGWRYSDKDDAVLTESQFSHWRLSASDRPD